MSNSRFFRLGCRQMMQLHATEQRRPTSAGIGEATVRKLVASGCKVVIADVSLDRGEALAADLGSDAAFCRCDVTCVPSLLSVAAA